VRILSAQRCHVSPSGDFRRHPGRAKTVRFGAIPPFVMSARPNIAETHCWLSRRFQLCVSLDNVHDLFYSVFGRTEEAFHPRGLRQTATSQTPTSA